MDMYRNDVAKAWKEWLKTFCIGHLMFKKLMININHYKHFIMKENEDFESYLSRVMLVLGDYRDANRGGVLGTCDLLGVLDKARYSKMLLVTWVA